MVQQWSSSVLYNFYCDTLHLYIFYFFISLCNSTDLYVLYSFLSVCIFYPVIYLKFTKKINILHFSIGLYCAKNKVVLKRILRELLIIDLVSEVIWSALLQWRKRAGQWKHYVARIAFFRQTEKEKKNNKWKDMVNKPIHFFSSHRRCLTERNYYELHLAVLAKNVGFNLRSDSYQNTYWLTWNTFETVSNIVLWLWVGLYINWATEEMCLCSFFFNTRLYQKILAQSDLPKCWRCKRIYEIRLVK